MLSPSDDHVIRLIFWLPGICAALHIIEEFVWPGRFLAWYREYRPGIAASITPRFALIGNAILVAATIVLGVMGPSWPRGLPLWLTLAALLAGNALFHVLGALRMRRYSPGMITGIFLYIPLCVLGFLYFVASKDASCNSQLPLLSSALHTNFGPCVSTTDLLSINLTEGESA